MDADDAAQEARVDSLENAFHILRRRVLRREFAQHGLEFVLRNVTVVVCNDERKQEAIGVSRLCTVEVSQRLGLKCISCV